MATIDDSLMVIWKMFDPDMPYTAEFGIPTFWRQNISVLGSPQQREQTNDDGTISQAFSGGVVIYDQTNGARLVTE